MRFRGTFAAGYGAACMSAVLAACSYDFDGLIAQPGETGGAAGIGGTAGVGGQGGTSGAGGADDDAGPDASGGAGTGGSAGKAGSGGSGGGTVDGGKAGTAGKGGSADAATDRGPDIADVRAEAAFDCTAVNGMVYQGHCYYPSNPTTNWDTARTTACAAPSHLVVITTAGEQAVAASILPGVDRWIGLKKELAPQMESSFRWVTGEALSFRTWEVYETGTPEPNYTGDCVRISAANNWGDINCNNMYPAICERE